MPRILRGFTGTLRRNNENRVDRLADGIHRMDMSAETVVEIGSLITRTPGLKGGRPCVAGTGVTVKRIVGWHRMGKDPEEIAAQFGHLNLAQVHAALAWYYANREEIDSDLNIETRDYERLAQEAEAEKRP